MDGMRKEYGGWEGYGVERIALAVVYLKLTHDDSVRLLCENNSVGYWHRCQSTGTGASHPNFVYLKLSTHAM
jgi:hypothetical protein